MKKVISLLLALAMLLTVLAGCGKEPAPPAPEQESTVQTPETPAEPEVPAEPEPEPEPEPVREAVELAFEGNEDKFKTYGRTYTAHRGLHCDWAASGIEFTVDCEGDIVLRYMATIPGPLQVSVDGAADERYVVKEGNTEKMTIAAGLTPGEHTVRVVRDHDIDTAGGILVLKTLEYTGFADTLRPAADQELYIEFIGDSITSGLGCLGGDRLYVTRFDEYHSATHAYSYLTAKALDADWSLVSRGGVGLFKATTNGNATAFDMYQSNNVWAKGGDYTFDRKADIVVLALGTNDSSSVSTGAEFREGFKRMVDLIREKNGEDVQIVCIWGMMSTTWGNQMAIASDECGIHCIRVTQDNNGSTWKEGATKHPHADGHAVVAQELTTYIKENVLPQMNK